MTLEHNGKSYELVELKEPNKDETFDIIGIFETEQINGVWEIKNFVNYFYGIGTEESIKDIATHYINEYEQRR